MLPTWPAGAAARNSPVPAPLGDIGLQRFLAEYWQKKPCLIRNAFPGFTPELDGHDLAGLACEPMAEARIVTGSFPAHDWTLAQGPFDEDVFARLGEQNWTLLVQDVEKHYPPLAELMQRFDFLPGWRLDDLMISWAAPGGSVGPHVDQYDVFLLQAEGRRRWQIAERFDPALLPDCELNVLRRFEAEQSWDLGPGDMLYLPPGVAHHGVAMTAGMTWSIGARAPDAADLLLALGETLAGDAVPRYTDPDLQPVERAGEIDHAALARLLALMRAPLDDAAGFRRFAGTFLTRFRLAQEPAPPEGNWAPDDLATALGAEVMLFRNPWTRLAWIEEDGRARLYAAGSAFECSIELAQALCASQAPHIDQNALESGDQEALMALLAGGHLVIVPNDD